MNNHDMDKMFGLLSDIHELWDKIVSEDEQEQAEIDAMMQDMFPIGKKDLTPLSADEAKELFSLTEEETYLLKQLKDRYDMVEVLDMLHEGVKFQRKIWKDAGREDIHIYLDDQTNEIKWKTSMMETPYIAESGDLLAGDWLIFE